MVKYAVEDGFFDRELPSLVQLLQSLENVSFSATLDTSGC